MLSQLVQEVPYINCYNVKECTQCSIEQKHVWCDQVCDRIAFPCPRITHFNGSFRIMKILYSKLLAVTSHRVHQIVYVYQSVFGYYTCTFCFSISCHKRQITCNGIYCQAFKSSPGTLSTHTTLFIIICYYFQEFLVASSSTLLLHLLLLITTTSTMQVHTCTLSLPPSLWFFLSLFLIYTYYTVVFQYFRMLFGCCIVVCYPFDMVFLLLYHSYSAASLD